MLASVLWELEVEARYDIANLNTALAATSNSADSD
jgi:hypothetical protein